MSLNVKQQENVNEMYNCVDTIETLAEEMFLYNVKINTVTGMDQLVDDCNALRQSITMCVQELKDVE